MDYLSFIESYAGPEYIFFYKAAVANLTMMVCFILGGCMPAFYLIGIVAIATQYTVDRVSLAYHYRLPPMYSEILTLGTLEMMSWIPLVTLIMLFWCYTNNQMFDNIITPINFEDEVRLSHHKFQSINWDSLSPAQSALGIAIIALFSFHIIRKLMDWWRARVEAQNKAIEISSTPLPNFFETIQEQDIEDYLDDYEHFTQFGFSFFNNKDKIKRLKFELEKRQ